MKVVRKNLLDLTDSTFGGPAWRTRTQERRINRRKSISYISSSSCPLFHLTTEFIFMEIKTRTRRRCYVYLLYICVYIHVDRDVSCQKGDFFSVIQTRRTKGGRGNLVKRRTESGRKRDLFPPPDDATKRKKVAGDNFASKICLIITIILCNRSCYY